MPRSSTTGLPFLARRTDIGKLHHRSVRRLGGRPTVKASLATGGEAAARVRRNRVHGRVESSLTGGVVRPMRNASRTASLDDARRFTGDLRLRDAKASLASRRLGLLDLGIEEAGITDPKLVAAIQDLAAGRIGRLTPEQHAARGAVPRRR